MRIVQTFWSGNKTADTFLQNKGGWLSAEYHLMAWALSVLQLRQFYDEVELVTDAAGKALLIDTLQLPYTSVQVVFDEALAAYPHDLWALAKIYTYSIQKEPFIHVDGDVFIWKRFDSSIENAALIAQNLEIDFPFYDAPLRTVQEDFQHIPFFLVPSDKPLFAANAGVIGGQQLEFFQEYKNAVFALIEHNQENMDLTQGMSANMFFEQFLLYALSKNRNLEFEYVVKTPQKDPTYPHFADFHTVPHQTWYIHCMAEYKRQEVVVQHLAKRLRQDYPTHYYRILRLCRAAGLPLHNQMYDLPELSPSKHDDGYFMDLFTADVASMAEAKTPLYFYAKDIQVYKAVEVLFGRPFEDILNAKIVLNQDVEIVEETVPILKQTLKGVNLQTQRYEEKVLDNLDMILYDAFIETKTIDQAIIEVGQYFPKSELEADYHKFQNLVLDRIRAGLYWGALAILHNEVFGFKQNSNAIDFNA